MPSLSPRRLSASLSLIFVICAFHFIALPQTNSSPHMLELGKPIEREIKGGETHNYELRLEAGQFVDVTIEQLGINVRGILQKPDGTTISEADSQRGARGFEMVCAIAEATGRYVLKIRSMRELAVPGKYYSLTDCISMNLMRGRGITEILTHDQHFTQEGFTILL